MEPALRARLASRSHLHSPSVASGLPACAGIAARRARVDAEALRSEMGSTVSIHLPGTLELCDSEIDVWCCLLDSFRDEDAALDVLDASEVERYRGYACEDAAWQFLAGRVLTRVALSHYANVPPRLWRFAANVYGRLAVNEPCAHRNIHFNLSHTSAAAVLAVGRSAEIGIDVEAIDRPVDIEWIGRSVFTQSESHWISTCPNGTERDRFFDLWTLKEAYIKARGMGFSLRPDSFELAEVNGQFKLRCPPDCDQSPERWRFRLFSAAPNLKIALAIGNRSVTRIRTLTCRFAARPVVRAG